MSESDHRILVHRFFDELLAQRDLDLVDAFCLPDVMYLSPTGCRQGIAELKAHLAQTLAILPDLRVEIVYVLTGETHAVARVQIHGTHIGDAPGLPATGRHISLPAFYAFGFARDRIQNIELCYDSQTFTSELTSTYPASLR